MYRVLKFDDNNGNIKFIMTHPDLLLFGLKLILIHLFRNSKLKKLLQTNMLQR